MIRLLPVIALFGALVLVAEPGDRWLFLVGAALGLAISAALRFGPVRWRLASLAYIERASAVTVKHARRRLGTRTDGGDDDEPRASDS